jgi:hypothetical protein
VIPKIAPQWRSAGGDCVIAKHNNAGTNGWNANEITTSRHPYVMLSLPN